MHSAQDTPEAVVAQAKEMIARVQADLDAGKEFFQRHGLGPAQLDMLEKHVLTEYERTQMEHAYGQETEKIRQEVAEERARRAFSNAVKKSFRRHPMV